MKAKITLIALRICVPNEFGQRWALDLCQALTLLWLFFDLLPDLIFLDFEHHTRGWKGMEGIDLSWSRGIKYSDGNGKFFGGPVTKDL